MLIAINKPAIVASGFMVISGSFCRGRDCKDEPEARDAPLNLI